MKVRSIVIFQKSFADLSKSIPSFNLVTSVFDKEVTPSSLRRPICYCLRASRICYSFLFIMLEYGTLAHSTSYLLQGRVTLSEHEED